MFNCGLRYEIISGGALADCGAILRRKAIEGIQKKKG
jgi:hypothetical protein